MSDIIIDDGDGWKVPDKAPIIDPTHEARVRLLSAVYAQRVLAIPSDASTRSRAVRFGKIKEKVRSWVSWMNTTYIHAAGATVKVTNDLEDGKWAKAEWTACDAVKAALDAGEPMTQFLFDGMEPMSV